jgi:hypothetical protein
MPVSVVVQTSYYEQAFGHVQWLKFFEGLNMKFHFKV